MNNKNYIDEEKRKLKKRIKKDLIFLFLGIIFLLISIISSLNDYKKNENISTNKKETSVNKINP